MQLPSALQLPPAAQAVVAISAVALAIVRLLTASKPFWAWEKVPVWVQKALPAALMAVAALPTAIEHARNWLDIVVGFVVTGSMWFTASRGDKRPPEDKGGGPRIERTNSDPRLTRDELEEKTPPSLPGVARFVAIGWMLVACSPAAPAKAPCDDATFEKMTRECTAAAAACVAGGKSEDECGMICDDRADERAKQCR